jgi:hemolysin D
MNPQPPQNPPRAQQAKTPDLAKAAVRSNRAYAEFLPAALEISARPAPKVVPVLLIAVIAVIAAALVWSWFSYLDVYTNAAGRVRAIVPPAVVQPLESGRVVAINVENGSKTSAGDVLLVLDDVEVTASLQAAVSGRLSWLAEVERRRAAETNAKQAVWTTPTPDFDPEIPANVIAREMAALNADFQTIAARLRALEAQLLEARARRSRFETMKAAQQDLVDILAEKRGMSQSLLSSGAGSKSVFLTSREAEARALAELAESAAQLTEADAGIRNLREQKRQAIAAFIGEQSAAIQTAERQIEQLDQEIVKQRARMAHLSLRAPIGGTVQQLAVTGLGQVVGSGQTMMVIVPQESDLVVEALVPSSDIGFVRIGDEATIKADAFPYTRYGAFKGKVASLSREAVTIRDAQALQDPGSIAGGQANPSPSGVPEVSGLFFIARIALASPEIEINGGILRLEPGMTVRAEIKTESRRVIDYVLSPVTQVLKEAGRER